MASQYSDSPGPSRVRSHPHLRPTPSIPFAHDPQSASLRPPTFESGSAPVLESVISSWQRYATVAGRQRNVSSPLDLEGGRKKKNEAMDNWQLLREVVEDGNAPVPGLRPKRSLSPLRAKVVSGSQSIRAGRSRDVDHQITDQLSSSPPGMNGFEGDTIDEESEPLRGIEDVLGRPNLPPERRPLLPRTVSATRAASVTRPPKADPSPSTEPNLASKVWPPSPATIAITKCCISYLIGSLFTFIPSLARILSTRTEEDAHGRIRPRPAYSAHMVATIVVYFHPAKSAGNMLLADRYASILMLFAVLMCLLSMYTIELFDHFSPDLAHDWDWISEIGDWVVNFLYIGGSMGVLAWAKLWVANPSFNSGCSMAAVTIFSVVIKEGNVPKLVEILLIVIFGVAISNIVCFAIFPTTATTRLQNSISRSLGSFSTLLDLLTSTFLLEQHVLRTNQPSIQQAITDHAKAFKTLKTDLAEAKHERVLDPRIRGRKLKLYDAGIGSLARLAQHLSGMRGSTKLQEAVIRASKEGRINLDMDEKIDSAPINPESADPDAALAASARLFMRFRQMSGAEMNGLNECCDDALDAVKVLTRTSDPNIDLPDTRSKLNIALQTFSHTSSSAIKNLYAGPRREQGVYYNVREDSEDEDLPALGDSLDGPNETVFQMYFFLFTFEEFAREMLFLLDTVIEIVHTETPSVFDHIRSVLPFGRSRHQPRHKFLYQQLQNLVPIDPSKLHPPVFPRAKKDSSSQLLRQLSLYARLRKRWWSFGEWLRQPEVRYSIKIWIGGAMLAAPAYTEWGRSWFLEFRGEWALIAFFSVNNPTLGQTNAMSFYRCAGTFIGALVGVIVYHAFPENPILLPMAGFIFSIPCFYIITQIPDHAQTGRFTILAYNLTCLYAYNSRERNYSVWRVAVYRSGTVIIGALWAAVVSRYWWPYTARRELRMGISDLCLDLSYLYSRLVDANNNDQSANQGQGEDAPLLSKSVIVHPHLTPSVQQLLAMELHLQSQLTTLRDLLVLTKNEPRLKGPFPTSFYSEVLLSLERMLDRLHSMRCVTTRSEWSKGVRSEFDAHVSKERIEMTGSVILYLYTISTGFRLRTPLPPYLPPAELNRQRLVAAIRELDVVKKRSARGGNKHLLYFAYALAMQEVITELGYLGEMMQETFGMIGQAP